MTHRDLLQTITATSLLATLPALPLLPKTETAPDPTALTELRKLAARLKEARAERTQAEAAGLKEVGADKIPMEMMKQSHLFSIIFLTERRLQEQITTCCLAL